MVHGWLSANANGRVPALTNVTTVVSENATVVRGDVEDIYGS
ncbi:MAG: hypothetical protein SFU56_06425 [Capsulimonadales bacterium]|nr:hypothetical protein [Capsulimonadales bacterium]